MTLLTVCHGGGVTERCDARCHDAKTPKCTCVCGGRFHGKGDRSQALFEAIKEHTAELVLRPEIQETDTSLLLYLSGLSQPPLRGAKQQTFFSEGSVNGKTAEVES